MQPKIWDGKRRGRSKTDTPSPVDAHVGSRVRLGRTLHGLSQERLGNAVGLTFQQIQKYERGANRIGASRLFDIARVLEVSVAFFFEDMPVETRGPVETLSAHYEPMSGKAGRQDQPIGTPEHDPIATRETLELVRAYYRIPDAQVRRRLLELATAIAGPITKPVKSS